MSAELIWATQDGDALVARMARVSNPKNADAPPDKLIRYLIENRHWSPFEMVSACVSIHTTRDIGRQILRHRSFSFQEFSQRYADVPGVAEPRPARMQDAKNRQASIPADDADLECDWRNLQKYVADAARMAYDQALAMGIAREVARVVLPEGLTPSHLYMAGTLRSWIHYLDLRSSNGTQREHQDIAARISPLIAAAFPISISAALQTLTETNR